MMSETAKTPFVVNAAVRQRVLFLAANGLRPQQVAHFYDVPVETIKKTFAKEFAVGFDTVYSLISGQLVRKALDGDKICMIFWLKTRAGWRETTRNEVTGVDGGKVDLRGVSTQDLLAAVAATERGTGAFDDIGGDTPPKRTN